MYYILIIITSSITNIIKVIIIIIIIIIINMPTCSRNINTVIVFVIFVEDVIYFENCQISHLGQTSTENYRRKTLKSRSQIITTLSKYKSLIYHHVIIRCACMHSFIHAFIHSFIHAFIHSFIRVFKNPKLDQTREMLTINWDLSALFLNDFHLNKAEYGFIRSRNSTEN